MLGYIANAQGMQHSNDHDYMPYTRPLIKNPGRERRETYQGQPMTGPYN
jgi:hypothetical protein